MSITLNQQTGTPECTTHGPMMERLSLTTEQAWCGTWHRCDFPGCTNAHLAPSPALAASLREQSTEERLRVLGSRVRRGIQLIQEGQRRGATPRELLEIYNRVAPDEATLHALIRATLRGPHSHAWTIKRVADITGYAGIFVAKLSHTQPPAKTTTIRCAHCGEPIIGEGHTWTGPLPKPGQKEADAPRYHLGVEYPECRRASGACGNGEPVA